MIGGCLDIYLCKTGNVGVGLTCKRYVVQRNWFLWRLGLISSTCWMVRNFVYQVDGGSLCGCRGVIPYLIRLRSHCCDAETWSLLANVAVGQRRGGVTRWSYRCLSVIKIYSWFRRVDNWYILYHQYWWQRRKVPLVLSILISEEERKTFYLLSIPLLGRDVPPDCQLYCCVKSRLLFRSSYVTYFRLQFPNSWRRKGKRNMNAMKGSSQVANKYSKFTG